PTTDPAPMNEAVLVVLREPAGRAQLAALFLRHAAALNFEFCILNVELRVLCTISLSSRRPRPANCLCQTTTRRRRERRRHLRGHAARRTGPLGSDDRNQRTSQGHP